MGLYKEIQGNLITLAKPPHRMFDVIAHGCNCFCKQKSGLAPQMAKAFGTDKFPKEQESSEGDMEKLGNIEYQKFEDLYVVNCYTQYGYDVSTKPLSYEALRLCLRKINHRFKGRHIGLPQIGCHLAGGDWNIVRDIIQKELENCDVTIVIYDNS